MRHATNRTAVRVVAAMLGMVLLLLSLAGCGGVPYEQTAVTEARETCTGSECHDEAVLAHAAGPHASVSCSACHEGAEAHAGDPETVRVAIDWRIDSCARCHETIVATYLYDDNTKVGPFGGSQREPAIHKADEFPHYDTIVAGHGFAREYDEEGAHRHMLQAHHDTPRDKCETCVQCKSTKVAWAWNTGAVLTVPEDRAITLTHTVTDDAPASEVVVPAGTTVWFSTDSETYEVDATALYADGDGSTYTSRPDTYGEMDEHRDMLWAATIAAIEETMPYGAGCNHCHDPHSGSHRVLRAAMLEAIEREGSVNPYDPEAPDSFDAAGTRDREILLCAQCHVEYTCGRSGVDRMVRDHFGWTKAEDLHERYLDVFDYGQDWIHAVVGEPLVKSQHPETELYWNSTHYQAGASCASCHMPRVRTSAGEWVRSHWFTSPYKYGNAATYGAFANSTGLRAEGDYNPCMHCHSDRTAQAIAGQERVYERQRVVQDLLAESVEALGRVRSARDAGEAIDASRHRRAVEAHSKAHVLWENLIVSENSMGFHNFDEVMAAMDLAEQEVLDALEHAREALAGE